jgi:hypothetical protein
VTSFIFPTNIHAIPSTNNVHPCNHHNDVAPTPNPPQEAPIASPESKNPTSTSPSTTSTNCAAITPQPTKIRNEAGSTAQKRTSPTLTDQPTSKKQSLIESVDVASKLKESVEESARDVIVLKDDDGDEDTEQEPKKWTLIACYNLTSPMWTHFKKFSIHVHPTYKDKADCNVCFAAKKSKRGTGATKGYIGVHQYFFFAAILDPRIATLLPSIMTDEHHKQLKEDIVDLFVIVMKRDNNDNNNQSTPDANNFPNSAAATPQLTPRQQKQSQKMDRMFRGLVVRGASATMQTLQMERMNKPCANSARLNLRGTYER